MINLGEGVHRGRMWGFGFIQVTMTSTCLSLKRTVHNYSCTLNYFRYGSITSMQVS